MLYQECMYISLCLRFPSHHPSSCASRSLPASQCHSRRKEMVKMTVMMMRKAWCTDSSVTVSSSQLHFFSSTLNDSVFSLHFRFHFRLRMGLCHRISLPQFVTQMMQVFFQIHLYAFQTWKRIRYAVHRTSGLHLRGEWRPRQIKREDLC